MTIRVTVEDTETGTSETREVANDYILICAGTCYQARVQAWPKTGTHVITIKGRK